jgi:Fe-S-cluster containining protein
VKADPIFACSCCGLCCRGAAVRIFEGTGEGEFVIHDRGDGVCVHLDTSTLLCRIYETRPEMCKVKEMCPRWLPLRVWYKINEMACHALQRRKARKDQHEAEEREKE